MPIYGHEQSGSNITTRGDYIITQYVGTLFGLTINDNGEGGTSSSDPSKNWTWEKVGADGAHAFAASNLYYMIDYKGYPDPIIKQSGSMYYIDYGAVDMDFRNGHWDINPDCTELPCPAGTTNQGTFYNHTAATAGTSINTDQNTFSEGAPDSICPKGWMLPPTDNKNKKSYKGMISNAYGGVERQSGANADAIALYPPISLLRSGYYAYDTTLMTNPGIYGYYWESQNYSDKIAYRLALFSNSLLITTAAGTGRGQGHSVRCVSRS